MNKIPCFWTLGKNSKVHKYYIILVNAKGVKKSPFCFVIFRSAVAPIEQSFNSTNEPLVALHINHTVKCSSAQTSIGQTNME